MNNPKKPKPIDLSEYTEEKIPFDDVIRKVGKVKPQHKPSPPKKKNKKDSK